MYINDIIEIITEMKNGLKFFRSFIEKYVNIAVNNTQID